MKKLILIIALTPAVAFAYIPSADFIFSKIVQNAGRGYYQIKQELSFQTQDRAISVTETWWVANENTMFLKVEGPLFTEYFLYKGNKKYFFTKDGRFVSSSLPKDFYENLYFYRTSQSLKDAFLSKKILPAQVFRKRPMIKTPKDEEAILNEPYLKLSRLKGSVTFVMGQATKDEQAPGIWVEQDRFLLKRIHFPSQADVSVDSFSELSRNLTYPKEQTISWGNQSVTIELARGDALNKPTEFFEVNKFSKLENQNKPIPDDLAQGIIGDFYKRFR